MDSEPERVWVDGDMAKELRRLSIEMSKSLGRKITVIDVTKILLPMIKGRPLTVIRGKAVFYMADNDGKEKIRLDELHI